MCDITTIGCSPLSCIVQVFVCIAVPHQKSSWTIRGVLLKSLWYGGECASWYFAWRSFPKSPIMYWLTHQWHSQEGGSVGAVAPVGLDSNKIMIRSIVHAAELNWKWKFFFLREAFCGLEYAENAFAAGNSDPTCELTTLFQPASRLGEDTPSKS